MRPLRSFAAKSISAFPQVTPHPAPQSPSAPLAFCNRRRATLRLSQSRTSLNRLFIIFLWRYRTQFLQCCQKARRTGNDSDAETPEKPLCKSASRSGWSEILWCGGAWPKRKSEVRNPKSEGRRLRREPFEPIVSRLGWWRSCSRALWFHGVLPLKNGIRL